MKELSYKVEQEMSRLVNGEWLYERGFRLMGMMHRAVVLERQEREGAC